MDNSLVYKQDVQRLVCRLNGCVGTNRNFENCEKRCPDFKAIDGLLIVQQHRRTGRWIDDAGYDKCSECGVSFPDLAPDYNKTNYCPNCGVRMKECENEFGGKMTKQTYKELKSLEAEIKQREEFEGDIHSCLLRCDEKDYIRFIKNFDAKLQREILVALYNDYQRRTKKLHNKFNELLEGEKNG